jgi:hypothetical protein
MLGAQKRGFKPAKPPLSAQDLGALQSPQLLSEVKPEEVRR